MSRKVAKSELKVGKYIFYQYVLMSEPWPFSEQGIETEGKTDIEF
jgi:hypothetical protein